MANAKKESVNKYTLELSDDEASVLSCIEYANFFKGVGSHTQLHLKAISAAIQQAKATTV